MDHSPAETEDLRSLMAGYQAGDIEAFDRLYARLAPPLRRYLTSLTRDGALAEDLLQETFLQVHRARRAYDAALPVEPWVFAIARHVHLMERRRRSRRGDLTLPAPLPPEPARPPEEGAWIARDQLGRELARLTPERRGALVLHHLWGFSFPEIASRLGIPAGAARLRASRGIASLRAALKRKP